MKRVKGLYVPFVKWSVFFLVFHNMFFKIGLMNEQYGNWANGVTHPYDWFQFWQRLVHIIFSMAGYDEFLAGAFWFFRALLVSSIVFLILYLLLYGRHKWLNHSTVPIVIAVLAVGFAWFKVANGLKIATIVQGGIRECWGVLFFAMGVLYRRHESRIPEHWALTLLYAALLVGGAALGFQGMALKVNLRTGPFRRLVARPPRGRGEALPGLLRQQHALYLRLPHHLLQARVGAQDLVLRPRLGADRLPHGHP